MKVKASKSRFKGTAVVETAIVFPLLLLLMLGVIQYSWLFLKAQQITNAARSGVRAAIRYGATEPDVTLAVTNALAATGMTVALPPVITPSIDPGVGNDVTVQLTSTSSVRLLGDVSFLPTPEILHASVTMAKEGP
jgi:Flp pilus assembly protein TadG